VLPRLLDIVRCQRFVAVVRNDKAILDRVITAIVRFLDVVILELAGHKPDTTALAALAATLATGKSKCFGFAGKLKTQV